MISSNRNKRISRSSKTLVSSLVVIAIVVIFLQVFVPSFLFETLYAVSTPFIAVRNFTTGSFSAIRTDLTSKANLEKENQELRADISNVNTSLISLEALQSENTSLMKIFARATSTPFRTRDGTRNAKA